MFLVTKDIMHIACFVLNKRLIIAIICNELLYYSVPKINKSDT